MKQAKKPRSWSWLLLFTTSGTLLCCALPITLVSLGLGATVARMVSSAAWLIALSQYKMWMFLISAVLIGLAIWAIYRPGRSCPADPALAAACQKVDSWNRRFIWLSAVMWVVGFLAAYVLPILVWIGWQFLSVYPHNLKLFPPLVFHASKNHHI